MEAKSKTQNREMRTALGGREAGQKEIKLTSNTEIEHLHLGTKDVFRQGGAAHGTSVV